MEDYRLEQSGQEVQDILNGAAMQVDLTAETERAELAETTLQGNIDVEERDRKDADLTLQGNIDAEEIRAKAAEKQNADDIDALEEKVPSGASASNKLATESYVDDSVATATATFRGTYNLVSDLHLTVDATEQQIATALALAISTADNNDYCFVQVPTSSETPTEIAEIDRYKYNGSAWAFEYALNNSGFTAAQWAAINSGITSGDVTKLAALPTNAELTTLLNGKQDVLTFDNVPTEGSSRPVKSGGVYSAIDDEKTARENADSSLSSAIEAILLLIPSAATSLNKLADKAFVNSSIATASATFRGTYNLVTDLSLTVSATHAQIATALAGAVSDEDNNDYAFVQVPTSDATPTQIAKTERYKYNGTIWEYEYDLNNSGYTAAQWAAINSGITEALVTKLSALPTNAELASALGVLTSSITTINQKIPNAASQANQLVDTAAMEAYIVQVLDVLTASFNVTSTDGHVTVSISQVDGKITSVSVSTSDIASAASLSLIAGRVTTAEGNISTNAADIANLQDAYAALTQSALVVVQPTDTWPVVSPATKTIYRVVDRVNTPPQYYSDYMWNGSAMVLMATYNNAIDDVPRLGSNNIAKSGGIALQKADREMGSEFIELPCGTVGCLHTDGVVYAEHTGYRTTDYIFVKAGQVVHANVGITYVESSPVRFFCVYDVNKTLIEAPFLPTEYINYTALHDCYIRVSTIRFSGNEGTVDKEIYLCIGDGFPIEKEVGKLKDVACFMKDFYQLSDNDEQGLFHENGYIISNPYFRTTDYIHLQKGESVCANVNLVATGDYKVLYIYDENKQPLGTCDFDTPVIYYTATKECYVRVSYYTDDLSKVYIVYGSKKDNPFYNVIYNILKPQSVKSLWKGKKIGFIGDSTTDPGSSTYVAQYSAMTGSVALNYGVSGTTVAVSTISNPMCQRVASLDNDLEMVVVLGGVNDCHVGVPLGDFEHYNLDGALDNTFYGAMHTMARSLKEKYPTKPIVFMTPLHNAYVGSEYGDIAEYNKAQLANGILVENKFPLLNGTTIDDATATGGTQSEYCEAIKKVCAFYGIHVIDLRAISGIEPIIESNRLLYMPDGCHPTTTAGGRKIAETIYPLLEQLGV